jgi:hypothetical protein
MNGETIGSFTETSPSSDVSASVAGSPYHIVLSSATGGTFSPTNYSIVYINGVLTVLPVTVVLPVAPAQLHGVLPEVKTPKIP